MKRIVFLAAVIIAFASCEKENHEEDNRIVICPPYKDTIVYKGTFERSSIAGRTAADVSLKFTNGVFSGSSSVNLFPAIGTGTFSTSANSVTFKNQSMWTANFDWTLILDGEFAATVKGDSLILTKFKGYDWIDTYNLKRAN